MSYKPEYIMGVDEGGYDDRTFVICVMNVNHRLVEYCQTTHDRSNHDKDVERLLKRYNISKDVILHTLKR